MPDPSPAWECFLRWRNSWIVPLEVFEVQMSPAIGRQAVALLSHGRSRGLGQRGGRVFGDRRIGPVALVCDKYIVAGSTARP